jgi:hypothetical protein
MKKIAADYKGSVRSRLLARRKIDDKGCWLWQGAALPSGYGLIGMVVYGHKSNRLVHRAALWAFGVFDILSPLKVLHHCDTPGCFNPEHLFTGTSVDNMRDAWNKGRINCEMQRHPRKLTPEDVLSIRSTYARGGCTTRSLATVMGLGKSTIEAVVNKRIWKHI